MAAPRPRTAALAAAGWTGFVWLTRVSNAVRDDDLGLAATVGALAVAVSFLTLAVVVVVAALRRRELLLRAVLALTVWTVAVWAVRVVDIAGSDHGIGFVVVHLLLAVVSVAACVVALLQLVEDRRGFVGRHPDR
ncbi:MAG TPA: hypothetical protein VJ804_02325 [Acidimicrobiales bacterium]|nr:hypothetical protein [Acidimicrobiales bacterium]